MSTALAIKLKEAVDAAVKTLTPALVQAGTLPPVDLSAIEADAKLRVELFEKPLMAAYSVLFGEIVIKFWPVFQTDADLLNQLQTIADAEDGDALKNLAAQLNQLTTAGLVSCC